MLLYRPPQMLNVIVISPMGMRLPFADLTPETTGSQLKQRAIDEFLMRNQLHFFAASATKLSRRYAIVHARSAGRLHEKHTLYVSGVCDGDEFYLTVKPRLVSTKLRSPAAKAPTFEQIVAATATMPTNVHHRTEATMLAELVKGVDVSGLWAPNLDLFM